ncbi:O-antigen polymerase [Candidatus Thiosymbion oneisti]|uniref:O-antigen polymerase n=1 Tax=Candidatus Thiosymbion oneisti TaxID=589554 RepID=UPI00105EAEA6|nr:O-antigen polymerase [Candidatus Thiosymbion oneisti]
MDMLTAIMFISICVYALTTNSDLCSPTKLYLVHFLVFYLGAWTSPQGIEIWLLMNITLMVGLFSAIIEGHKHTKKLMPNNAKKALEKDKFTFWIWLFTLPALAARLYLVYLFGGIEGYADVLPFRVIEFRGLGWLTSVANTHLVVNLVYFAVGVTGSRNKKWWTGYAIHFFLFVIFGLLSGSRTGVLIILPLLMYLVHYLKRRVSITFFVVVALLSIVSAIIMGVVRKTYSYHDGQLNLGLEDKVISFFDAEGFRYGILPLKILLSEGLKELQLGTTFATIFTNAIPRYIYPEKPDTGGVVFTKLYTGDAWLGASNLTPTFLGEWVINFGWGFGVVFFVVSYSWIMLMMIKQYKRNLYKWTENINRKSAFDATMYIVLLWSMVALMVGESTNVIVRMFVEKIIPLAAMRVFFLSKFKY